MKYQHGIRESESESEGCTTSIYFTRILTTGTNYSHPTIIDLPIFVSLLLSCNLDSYTLLIQQVLRK